MNLIAHLYRQRAFSRGTFGPGERTDGVCEHIKKELEEIASAHTLKARQDEWIDVIILALDGAWRSGLAPEDITAAIEWKQEVNENRQWPDWRTAPKDKAIEHVK